MASAPELYCRAVDSHRAGDLQSAENLYRQILDADPYQSDARHMLGVLAYQTGRRELAIRLIGEALNLKPGLAEGHGNLGNVLMAAGRLDEAIACYRRAIELKPDFGGVFINLAVALSRQGKLDEAVACFYHLIRLQPDYAEAHNNLGNALHDVGRPDDAIASYRRAIELKPDCADAYNNLGTVLREQDQLDEAVASFRMALQYQEDFANTHTNLGNALGQQGNQREAIACYRRAMELKPDYTVAHSNLLYTLHFLPGCDTKTLALEHRRWYEQHAASLAKSIRPHENDRSPERRLRIGYLSTDFRDHVVGRNLWPLLSNHDHTQFELVLYADVLRPDWMTEQMRRCADHWCSVAGWTDEAIAERIRRDGIDILIDLNQHMAGGRPFVFARKPAPVQVGFAGYPASTGLATIDYRLTDPYLDPPGSESGSAGEKPYHLPHTFWCFDPLTEEPGVAPLPAERTGVITFGCLNNFAKINEEVLALWARVLRVVNGSRLLLLAPEGSCRQRAMDVLADHRIPRERVGFSSRKPRSHYLTLYHDIDIGLDSFPYNGHTTSLDSYWMGVPVVTLVGNAPVSRAGLSQLTNLGLDELAGRTPEEFIAIAAQLAGERSRLSQLRAGLRERMRQSPLMDAPRFARDIEAAYRTMWERWCANQPQ
jgi:predicted O-linked N-acetylglucosamine transferase (SPINDLY family)